MNYGKLISEIENSIERIKGMPGLHNEAKINELNGYKEFYENLAKTKNAQDIEAEKAEIERIREVTDKTQARANKHAVKLTLVK